MKRVSFIRQSKLTDLRGRINYISSPERQENLYATYSTAPDEYWRDLARENREDFKCSGTAGKCIEARELIIALPPVFSRYDPDAMLKDFADRFKDKYDVECTAALHHNKTKSNLHIHLIYSERKELSEPEVKIATRTRYYDPEGKHVRTKKEATDEHGELLPGYKVIKKGEIYEKHRFEKKNALFKSSAFLDDVKAFMTDLINTHLPEQSQMVVFPKNSPYLPTKKIGKNNPKEAEIKENNMISQGQYFNPLVPLYLFPAGADWTAVQYFERYDADRNFAVQYWPYGRQAMSMQNPYWITERNNFVNHKVRNTVSAVARWDITGWLALTGRVRYDNNDIKHESKLAAGTDLQFASKYGHYGYEQQNKQYRQYFAEAFATVNKYWDQDRWSLSAVLGTNYDKRDERWTSFDGHLAQMANIYSLRNVVAGGETKYDQGAAPFKKLALYGSAQLGYRSMAYLDVTARNDWSSKLANAQESYFYWSAGLSGIITEMVPAMRSQWLNYLKLRLSYAEVGNDPWRHGLTITTYSLSPAGVTTTAAMPNLDLKAERTKSWEAGLDLVMFNNRLRVNATLYSSQTYNQFFNINLPSSSGYTSTWVNGGRVDNRGVELTARYTQPLGPITWETYLTWTLNHNKIKELLPYWKNPVDGEVYSLTELDKGGLSGYKTRLVEGGTLSDIYVNQLSVGEHGEYYVDPQSHTLRTDDGNYTLAGSAAPRYNLSWGNELTFKGLTLGFQLAYRNGGIVVSQTQAIMDAFGASQASADAREAGGVMINGMLYPAADYYQTVASSSHVIGSQYVYSATNLRLSELSLSYDVPVQRWQRVIKGLTLSLVGHNLLLLYCKAPFDPELTANTGTYGQGLDYFMQPSLRTMGCSVKLRF